MTDGSGSLKTAPQGTQTVHVDNSSIQTAPAKANFSWSHQYDMDAGGFGATTEFQGFGSDVLISLVVVGNADDSVTINFRNDFGFAALFLRGGGEDGSDNFQLPLTQPIEANGVLTRCTNLAESCKFFVSVVGTVVH